MGRPHLAEDDAECECMQCAQCMTYLSRQYAHHARFGIRISEDEFIRQMQVGAAVLIRGSDEQTGLPV